MSTPPPPSMSAAPPPPPGSMPIFQQGFGRIERTNAEKKAEKSADRAALRSLAAKPEILGVIVAAVMIYGFLITFDAIGLILGILVFGVFGWTFMSNGDAIVASLILGGLGILTASLLGAEIQLSEDSLWWIFPALVMIAAESAIGYNHFRRRNGEISVQVGRTLWLNVIMVTAASVVVALALRFVASGDRQVQWPWFATTVGGLVTCGIIALVVVRRNAAPADRRRFSPGRRMIPPPR